MAFDPTLYVVDPETGDIKPPARKTLGQYLSKKTSKDPSQGSEVGGPDEYTYSPPRPNPFPVSPQSSLTDGGTIIDPSSNSQETFVRNQEDMKRFEDAKVLTSDPSLNGAETQRALYDIPSEPDAVSTNPVTARAQQHISSVLTKNRFSQRSPLVSTNGDPGIQNIPVIQYNRGQMRLGSSENHVTPTSETSGLYRRMRDEGLKILLRASGVTPNMNVLETGAEKALVTGESISGGLVKIPVDEMRPREALGNTSEREGSTGTSSSRRLAFVGNEILDLGDSEASGVREPQYNGGSYGVLNTYLNPFDGILPISMIFNMVILLIASLVAALVLGGLLSFLIRASNRVDFAHGEIGTLGAERNPDSVGKGDAVRKFFTDFLGLIQPYNDDYVTLVAKGAASYTGFSEEQVTQIKNGNTKVDALGVVGSVLSLLGSSGYYVVTSRSIVRNLEVLGNGAQDMAREFTTGGGAVSGIESLATFIDMLRKSRIVRFVDTLARLGAAQEYQEMNTQKLDSTLPSSATSRSATDTSLRVSRSRARVSERTLSWGFREANSMGAYLIPTNFQIAQRAWTGDQSGVDAIKRMSTDFRLHRTRISSEVAAEYEKKLDAEYVPFYMQDLRTNEILNFHAFIEDLSDSYAAEYNQVSAYGRMDPVQIYKGTTRSISMTFMLVATSREDFDAMWFSINKLTSLVYPEWSKGTEITGAGDDGKDVSFIQPFSQIPTSSPLIRLRVGDLIRSNYSRFNLARVFGLGESAEGENDKKGKAYLLGDIAVDESYGWGEIGNMEGDAVSITTLSPRRLDEITVGEVAVYTGQSIEVNGYFDEPGKVNVFGSGAKPYRVILRSGVELKYSQSNVVGTKSKTAPTSSEPVTLEFVNEADKPRVGENIVNYVKLPLSSLYLKAADVKSFNTTKVVSSGSISSEGLSTFKTTERGKVNSIVRSFEAAGGKGLAGVITSLTYTWYDDSTPWETDRDAKAPMMCKVAIQFNPIHDIPMGLDSNGFMRAPAYPVGAHVNSIFFPTGSI
jgi:hypothetical protein